MARQLSGIVVIRGTDDENWPWTDERVERSTPVNAVLDIDQPASGIEIPDLRWGGECRVEVNMTGRVVANGAIQIDGTAKLFEGSSEDTTDLDDQKGFTFLVPRNTLKHTEATRTEIQLSNAGFGGGDHAEIALYFTNLLIEEE